MYKTDKTRTPREPYTIFSFISELWRYRNQTRIRNQGQIHYREDQACVSRKISHREIRRFFTTARSKQLIYFSCICSSSSKECFPLIISYQFHLPIVLFFICRAPARKNGRWTKTASAVNLLHASLHLTTSNEISCFPPTSQYVFEAFHRATARVPLAAGSTNLTVCFKVQIQKKFARESSHSWESRPDLQLLKMGAGKSQV